MTRPLCLATWLLSISVAFAQSTGPAPAPPIPDPPAEPTRPAILDAPTRPALNDDPFQQTPRATPTKGDALRRASEAFATERYTQALAAFNEAAKSKETLTPKQKDEWAYCRLHAVATRLNTGETPSAELAREVDDASATGSDRLRPFADQLRAKLGPIKPAAAATISVSGQSLDTPSFRIVFAGNREFAVEVGQVAEAARKAMYERWVGPPAGNWSPRCDVHLHATAAAYAKATGKAADNTGHATVNLKGPAVASRRIDLRLDDAALIEATLPAEITHVVLTEMYAEQPLPRWAIVGMAALAESPESVARYRRAVPGLLKDKKLFAVGPFLDRGEFPDAASITPFYAESVSLVSYLVELRGTKQFAAFLREAPRRGYAKALTTHYGFKDAADFQDKWVKHAMGGD